MVATKTLAATAMDNNQLKAAVGTLPEGYVRNVPLPRVPKIQRARSHQVTKIPDYYKDSYAVSTYDITRKQVESTAYAFSPTWHDIAFNTYRTTFCLIYMAIPLPL
jgi:hypothetical protein